MTAAIDQYPDRHCLGLRAALAQNLGISAGRILPGNGCSELIWLAALAFARPGDRVLVLGPTFCEYTRVSALMGASVTTWEAHEASDFVPDLDEIDDCIQSLRPRLVFLCNPNNPTGVFLPPAAIARIARRHPGTLFVVDEAYHAFAEGASSLLGHASANILLLRSMTKDHALAGLRLGYAIADEKVIDCLRRVQPPWSVNALAQTAGIVVLGESAGCRHSLQCLATSARELAGQLTALGLAPVPSRTHFFLVRVGDGSAFRSSLLRRGVLVRDCASFGLPAYVRIAARRPEDNARLVALLREGV